MLSPRAKRRLSRSLRILLVTALVAGVPIAIDSVSRQFMDCRTSTELVDSPYGANNLVVYMPGMTAGGRESSEPFIDILLRHGDVLIVDYGDSDADLFCEDGVARKTAAAIEQASLNRNYDHVVMLGSSIGGMLSVDAIGYIQQDILVDLVPICAPTSSRDLFWPGNMASGLRPIPIGLIGNWLDLDPSTYKASFWRDQAVYIVSHGSPESGSLDSRIASLTYLDCTADEKLVKQSAGDVWSAAFNGSQVVDVPSGHVDYRANPKLWRQVFDRLLGSLIDE